jgi:hypothetical protein
MGLKKARLFITLTTLTVVGVLSYFAFMYARGYRLDSQELKLSPNGILVLKSEPEGAQIYINGELKTVTNSNLFLPPDTYDITVKKEGYFEWSKRMEIRKEETTESTAHLFKTAPSLTAVTFFGAENPVLSNDQTKLAYVVPAIRGNDEHNLKNAGLWVIEIVNLPIGFAREPRRVTDGDLSGSTYEWSADDRQILITSMRGIFLLDSSSFTSQVQRSNYIGSIEELKKSWEEEKVLKLETQIRNLPEPLQDILRRKTSQVIFSPDKKMILYTASDTANLREGLVKPFPGASSQKQERDIKPGNTYTYDITEDRNFLIDDGENLVIGSRILESPFRRITWFPTSRHLIIAEEEKITISDYDGTNKQVVFMGNYISPNAFPALTIDRIYILTNLGGGVPQTGNIYSLSLK